MANDALAKGGSVLNNGYVIKWIFVNIYSQKYMVCFMLFVLPAHVAFQQEENRTVGYVVYDDNTVRNRSHGHCIRPW